MVMLERVNVYPTLIGIPIGIAVRYEWVPDMSVVQGVIARILGVTPPQTTIVASLGDSIE